ncbi:MAG: LacI family transcriptional regulator [Candidatus Binatia bacterium]|jgi:LacI family transcriptional regulator
MNQSDKSSKRVALAIETSHGSGREVLRGIAQYTHEKGDWRLFHIPRGLMESVPDWLRDWEGEGIIARVQDEEMARALRKLKIPVVDVLGVTHDAGIPVVHVDDLAIGRRAAQFLANAGLRNFGFFGIAGENWSTTRLAGFRETAEAEGGSVRWLEAPRELESNSQALRETIGAWLRTLPLPTGIMVSSDQRALHLLESCRELDIFVPEMASVISVDNDACLCELPTPTLTSIRAGHSRAGYEAARLLDRLMSGENAPPASRHPIPVTGIVERGSTDSPAVSDDSVARGLRHIRENIAGELANERIARAAGISRTLFQRKFLSITGLTVQSFVLQSRLKKVERLMRHDQLSLLEIAELCGFRHQQYLGYIVKREYGKTPAAWRNELLKTGQS